MEIPNGFFMKRKGLQSFVLAMLVCGYAYNERYDIANLHIKKDA